MPKQLRLDLGQAQGFGRAEYFVSDANAAAIAFVENWHSWPDQRCLLIGPNGAGKSHLAQIWANEIDADIKTASEIAQAKDGALVLEDAQQIAGDPQREEALFHLLNRFTLHGIPILMTCTQEPHQWGLKTPDLQSRLQAAGVAKLAPPDDDLVLALLTKQFSDRGLHVKPKVLNYLATRMERNYRTIQTLVSTLDDASLERGREITIHLAKELIPES